MKKQRFTKEQIIGILREQEAGAKTADLARKYAISHAVATQDPIRQRALVVPQKANEVASLHRATVLALAEMVAAPGLGIGLDETSRRLQSVPGLGPITASAIVATVGDASQFKSGRQFAAWLGLVPQQRSSGGKERLGGTCG